MTPQQNNMKQIKLVLATVLAVGSLGLAGAQGVQALKSAQNDVQVSDATPSCHQAAPKATAETTATDCCKAKTAECCKEQKACCKKEAAKAAHSCCKK